MKKKDIVQNLQWHLPYEKKDIIEVYENAYKQALLDVIKRANGEVINGVLVSTVKTETVVRMLDESIE